MEYSQFQKDIFNWVQNGSGNAVVRAVAGSGKTTTLIESLNLITKNKRVCLLAFNKSIAEELKRRTPTHINVQTFHSLGWSVMRMHLNNPVLDDNKVYNHIQTLFKQKRISFKDFSQKIKISNNIKKIIDFLRLNLVEIPSSLDIHQICLNQDIEILDNEISLSLQLYSGIIEDDSCYDFVDMLFIPVFRKLKFPKFDWVFTDECQDASIIQQKMMELCIAEGGRFMAVGDPSQSLYAFAGADANAYENFTNQPNTIQLPLSICYRCGSSIIKEAQKLVPEIQHWDKNGVGQIVENGSIKNVKDGDVVLCRVNFPLAALAGNFLRENKKVSILGSDFGKNLSKLIESCKGTSTAELFSFLAKKLQKIYDEIVQENSFVDPNTQPEYQLMLDKINTIRALSENCENIKEVLAKIQTIFSDSIDKTGILLSTVHKFKGRESENVYIIEPQLIPFPYYLHLPNQAKTENNIKYVAITRAKNKLEYIRDWTAYTKDETKRKSRPKNKLRNKSHLPLQDEDEGHDHG